MNSPSLLNKVLRRGKALQVLRRRKARSGPILVPPVREKAPRPVLKMHGCAYRALLIEELKHYIITGKLPERTEEPNEQK